MAPEDRLRGLLHARSAAVGATVDRVQVPTAQSRNGPNAPAGHGHPSGRLWRRLDRLEHPAELIDHEVRLFILHMIYSLHGSRLRAAIELASDVEGLRLVLASTVTDRYRVLVVGTVIGVWRR